MSSNIRIKKVCHHCDKTFIAKTTVTKFCSDDCAKRNYKKRQKEQKVTTAILETNESINEKHFQPKPATTLLPSVEHLQRDWVNAQHMAELLGVAERTFFRLLKDPVMPRLKIGRKLLFNKQEVFEYFISKSERV